MPTPKATAASVRESITAAKTKPVNPAKGRTIGQNVKQSLARVLNVPATEGTGTINAK